MPEHQQIQRSKKTNTIFQTQATPVRQTPVSNPYSIIQRAKVNPRSLTRADIMQLQRTIGNQAVGRLLSSIGSSSTAQHAPVQRQEMPEEETCPSCMQRQEIPEEEEPLQGKMTETLQRQEIPEEEEPLQKKMADTVQRQGIPEEEEPLQGKLIEPIQRQEIPEEEEPLQGKMIGTIQRQEIPEEEEPLQGKFENKPEIACPSCFAAPLVQRQEIPEEEEPLQGKMIDTVQRQEIPEEEEPLQTKRENNTGMPDNLKAGVESLSGIDMSDVRVHYNSSKPAEVGALAYTQGANIHVAPGQEMHLPHEAWHVVQQAQGRVRPTMQLKEVAVNDDEWLEHEADLMGTKATKCQVSATSESETMKFPNILQLTNIPFFDPPTHLTQPDIYSESVTQARWPFDAIKNWWYGRAPVPAAAPAPAPVPAPAAAPVPAPVPAAAPVPVPAATGGRTARTLRDRKVRKAIAARAKARRLKPVIRASANAAGGAAAAPAAGQSAPAAAPAPAAAAPAATVRTTVQSLDEQAAKFWKPPLNIVGRDGVPKVPKIPQLEWKQEGMPEGVRTPGEAAKIGIREEVENAGKRKRADLMSAVIRVGSDVYKVPYEVIPEIKNKGYNPKTDEAEVKSTKKISQDAEIYFIDIVESILQKYPHYEEQPQTGAQKTEFRFTMIGPAGTCDDCQSALQNKLSEWAEKYKGLDFRIIVRYRGPQREIHDRKNGPQRVYGFPDAQLRRYVKEQKGERVQDEDRYTHYKKRIWPQSQN